jgi:hypothetical protein
MRYVAYHPLLIGESRPDVMKHLLAGSLALLSTRRVTGRPYDNVFVCRGLVEYKAVTHDRNTQVFPLRLVEPDEHASLFSKGNKKPNLPNIASDVLANWVKKLGIQSPEELLNAVYALLFSAEYRRRYREPLQRDYARVPQPLLPELNRRLVEFGSSLIALHLMVSPTLDKMITTYIGPEHPEVEKVGWSDDTVWLDAAATKQNQHGIAGTIGFRGVSEAVWNLHIGGYQVCEKWLKDRKGRKLSKGEIAHYQKIVVALAETIRLMNEIDKVIDDYGGWPAAFQTVEGTNTLIPSAVEITAT